MAHDPFSRKVPRRARAASLWRPFPIATVSVLLITAAVTGLQFPFPGILAALRRRPGALTDGEGWRLVTPLFVHADGWSQIIVNFISIAAAGVAVERLYGSLRWPVLYFIPGIVGEVAGFAWQPTGAGASFGAAGLFGGLLAWLLLRGGWVPWPARVWGPIWLVIAVVLIVVRDPHGPPIIAGAVIGTLMLLGRGDDTPPARTDRARPRA